MKILLFAILFTVIFIANVFAEDKIKWIDAEELGIKGKGFPDAKAYRRLSDKDLETMHKILPYIGEPKNKAFPYVGECSAGLHIDFKTNARIIKVRWSVKYCDFPTNITFSNQSGLDLYILLGDKFRYVNTALGDMFEKDNVERTLVNTGMGRIPGGMNEYTLNLATYDEVTKLEIGIPENAKIESVPDKPDYIAIYGTSITQGGCASRPGMIYSHMLRRELNEEIVNLGFSGSGLLQPEMTDILCKLNPKLMIMDSLANMGSLKKEDFYERFEYFYTSFRKAHPKTPILFLGHPAYTNSWTWYDYSKGDDDPTNVYTKDLINKWNDPNVYFIEGKDLYGDDWEGTVDSVHATDLAYVRITEKILPVILTILKSPKF